MAAAMFCLSAYLVEQVFETCLKSRTNFTHDVIRSLVVNRAGPPPAYRRTASVDPGAGAVSIGSVIEKAAGIRALRLAGFEN
jgi:hypothetical protein